MQEGQTKAECGYAHGFFVNVDADNLLPQDFQQLDATQASSRLLGPLVAYDSSKRLDEKNSRAARGITYARSGD
jgi:hypothetical protein